MLPPLIGNLMLSTRNVSFAVTSFLCCFGVTIAVVVEKFVAPIAVPVAWAFPSGESTNDAAFVTFAECFWHLRPSGNLALAPANRKRRRFTRALHITLTVTLSHAAHNVPTAQYPCAKLSNRLQREERLDSPIEE
jgi:hypothetical protein